MGYYTARYQLGHGGGANGREYARVRALEPVTWYLNNTIYRLKYGYLLCLNEDILPLDQWTFNTEAHPLPIFHWADWEKERYGIVSKSHHHAARHNQPHSGLD